MSEEPPKHLTVFSSETLNIKKLANLTANTKNYGQITLNPKPIQTLLFWVCVSYPEESARFPHPLDPLGAWVRSV